MSIDFTSTSSQVQEYLATFKDGVWNLSDKFSGFSGEDILSLTHSDISDEIGSAIRARVLWNSLHSQQDTSFLAPFFKNSFSSMKDWPVTVLNKVAAESSSAVTKLLNSNDPDAGYSFQQRCATEIGTRFSFMVAERCIQKGGPAIPYSTSENEFVGTLSKQTKKFIRLNGFYLPE